MSQTRAIETKNIDTSWMKSQTLSKDTLITLESLELEERIVLIATYQKRDIMLYLAVG